MNPIIKTAQDKMNKALGILQQDLGSIRAGRANATLIEHVKVKVYGGTQELTIAELATISSSDSRTLLITPFDKSIIDEIERGLLQTNLGVSVAQDGAMVRLTIPPLTAERRDEFVKLAKTKTEGVRVMIRQIRQDVMNSIREQLQSKEITEDEKFRLEKDVQKITDDTVTGADQLLEKKIAELVVV